MRRIRLVGLLVALDVIRMARTISSSGYWETMSSKSTEESTPRATTQNEGFFFGDVGFRVGGFEGVKVMFSEFRLFRRPAFIGSVTGMEEVRSAKFLWVMTIKLRI